MLHVVHYNDYSLSTWYHLHKFIKKRCHFVIIFKTCPVKDLDQLWTQPCHGTSFTNDFLSYQYWATGFLVPSYFSLFSIPRVLSTQPDQIVYFVIVQTVGQILSISNVREKVFCTVLSLLVQGLATLILHVGSRSKPAELANVDTKTPDNCHTLSVLVS